MTEDFKKGLATGLAVGGVTVVKGGGGDWIKIGEYVSQEKPQPIYDGMNMTPPSILMGDYIG